MARYESGWTDNYDIWESRCVAAGLDGPWGTAVPPNDEVTVFMVPGEQLKYVGGIWFNSKGTGIVYDPGSKITEFVRAPRNDMRKTGK